MNKRMNTWGLALKIDFRRQWIQNSMFYENVYRKLKQ